MNLPCQTFFWWKVLDFVEPSIVVWRAEVDLVMICFLPDLGALYWIEGSSTPPLIARGMFWADFGSNKNGSVGESVGGCSTLLGWRSGIGVLRGHWAKATQGVADCFVQVQRSEYVSGCCFFGRHWSKDLEWRCRGRAAARGCSQDFASPGRQRTHQNAGLQPDPSFLDAWIGEDDTGGSGNIWPNFASSVPARRTDVTTGAIRIHHCCFCDVVELAANSGRIDGARQISSVAGPEAAGSKTFGRIEQGCKWHSCVANGSCGVATESSPSCFWKWCAFCNGRSGRCYDAGGKDNAVAWDESQR